MYPIKEANQLASSTLGVVYTTQHEVISKPCKICDWLLNLSWDHFGLHQEKMSE